MSILKGVDVAGNTLVATIPGDVSQKPSDAKALQEKKAGSDGQKGKDSKVQGRKWARSKSVGGGAAAPPADTLASQQHDPKPPIQSPSEQQAPAGGQVVDKSGGGVRKKDDKEIQGKERKKGQEGSGEVKQERWGHCFTSTNLRYRSRGGYP